MNKALNNVRDKLFSKVHGNNLIYNTCWEDPTIDRKLLNIDQDSEIVMITSAGCNALDYLLDNPSQINCIDLNFRQNALLELKRCLIRTGDFSTLFSFFGDGYDPKAKEKYDASIREKLPYYAQAFWDDKLHYFYKNGKKKSFYFFGTSGTFAWLFKKYIDRKKGVRAIVDELLGSKTLAEQHEKYSLIEPQLLGKMTLWLMNRHLTMSLLGVPRAQRDLIVKTYPDGMGGFLKDNLKHIFTDLPIQDNYFWHLYLNGKYSKECAPNYLKEENFKTLSERIGKININTTSIADFLKEHPGEYSHFILLDHQDWLAHHDMDALVEEWKLILKNSKKGTKILLRSASVKVNFIPDFVLENVDFDEKLAHSYHQFDRVGTYGSTYIGTVK